VVSDAQPSGVWWTAMGEEVDGGGGVHGLALDLAFLLNR
jgi:hypothetical protein